MFTVKNATIIALMQVGVIVIGVLASGLWHRASISNGLTMPTPAAWLYNQGVFSLALPLIWITAALLVHRRPDISDEAKALMFWLGLLLLIGLVVFVFYADVAPCFHLPWPSNQNEDSV